MGNLNWLLSVTRRIMEGSGRMAYSLNKVSHRKASKTVEDGVVYVLKVTSNT